MIIDPTELLIAPPNIPDHRFHTAVIMLTHTDPEEVYGICLNKVTEYVIDDLIRDIGYLDINLPMPLYWGGPVNQQSIWMLHSNDWQLDQGTVILDHQWSMTSHKDMFREIASGSTPRLMRFFSGYCTWSPQQLKAELLGTKPWSRNHSWLTAKNPGIEWVFEEPVEQLWKSTTKLSANQAVETWL